MFIAAYYFAMLLWLPLLALFVAARRVGLRWLLAAPIGLAMLVSAWEASVPSQANIRIDLFLTVPLMALFDGAAGIMLAITLYQRRRAAQPRSVPLMTAAALCLAAPIALAIGWDAVDRENRASWRAYEDKLRNDFEVSFRDDAAQRAAYGDLQAAPWAGYYRAENPRSPNYAHLVVNAAGDVFMYSDTYSRWEGHVAQDPTDAALLTGRGNYLSMPDVGLTLRDLGGGRVSLRWGGPNPSEATFVKTAPPRFPRSPSL